ncbi:MAG: hypothetical protein JRG93_03560 [Deltaproteobacteria bacterium]|nr:hypothetical protein [Deltaproteobacteria bacterium]
MSIDPDRWEVGSLFHAADFEVHAESRPEPWDDGLLTGCGRDALRLIGTLARHRRWWIPSYFCQQVIDAVTDMGIELLVYPDSPLSPGLDLSTIDERPGDAVLVVNYFGLRTAADISIPEGFSAEIIEDHTHAPTSSWARASNADFCVASLRKLYPLADGGALWSPRGHGLPDTPTVTSPLQLAAFEKLTGMLLKRAYLEGHSIAKEAFRPTLEAGEDSLLGPEISAITPLSRATLATFPLAHWEGIQLRNFKTLLRQVPSGQGFRILAPSSNTSVPFSAFCVFDQIEECERVRAALIANQIYASRLWPLDKPILDGVPEEHARLSQRSFSIPIDMRYGLADVDRVAACLVNLVRVSHRE